MFCQGFRNEIYFRSWQCFLDVVHKFTSILIQYFILLQSLGSAWSKICDNFLHNYLWVCKLKGNLWALKPSYLGLLTKFNWNIFVGHKVVTIVFLRGPYKVSFTHRCISKLSHSKNLTSLFPLIFLSKHISLYAIGRIGEF